MAPRLSYRITKVKIKEKGERIMALFTNLDGQFLPFGTKIADFFSFFLSFFLFLSFLFLWSGKV